MIRRSFFCCADNCSKSFEYNQGIINSIRPSLNTSSSLINVSPSNLSTIQTPNSEGPLDSAPHVFCKECYEEIRNNINTDPQYKSNLESLESLNHVITKQQQTIATNNHTIETLLKECNELEQSIKNNSKSQSNSIYSMISSPVISSSGTQNPALRIPQNLLLSSEELDIIMSLSAQN